MTTALGLLRDFVAAALAVAILFGANISDDQVAGVLLLTVTGAALGSYAVKEWKKSKGAAPE